MELVRLAQEAQTQAEAVASGDTGAQARLLKAIQRLTLAAETPTQTIRRISYQPVQNAIIRLAVEMRLPHLLVENGKKPITAAQLSQKIGGSQALIARVMRVLAASAICEEVGEEEYKSNSLTEVLASPTFTGGTKYLIDGFTPIASKLPEYMHKHEYQNPQGKNNPFEYTFHTHVWDWVAKTPGMQASMMDYMSGRKKGGLRWIDIVPAVSFSTPSYVGNENVLFIDIGGNKGHDLMLFKERYPDLHGRCILMDLPEAVSNVVGTLQDIEVISYDFFTPQPIKGAQFYFFRAICHDWSDDECRKFLRNTAEAMGKHSRLLINDYILPDTGADLFPSLLDIMMMCLCAGVERTEKQFRALLDSVGLEIVNIWGPEGMESVIEARLKAQ